MAQSASLTYGNLISRLSPSTSILLRSHGLSRALPERRRRYLHAPTSTSTRSPCQSYLQPTPPVSRRSYYTPSSPPPAPFNATETAILSAAIAHVPIHGFTTHALSLGVSDAGYLPASTNLFPRGAFDLVLYHLITQRLVLADSVQFPETNTPSGKPPGVSAKIRTLLLARLRANEPLLHQMPGALALMSLAGNIPASLAELGRLSDEMLYLAGDLSVDSSWYTKRGALASVYAAAEVFQSQDKSPGCVETEGFVDRRLEDVRRIGGAVGSVNEWIGYTGISTVNVLRSLGVRI